MRWNAGDPCPSGIPEMACRHFGKPSWVAQIRGAIRICVVGGCGTFATAYFLLDDTTGEVFGFGTP